jgi:tetratricopeptide (TPR) repeat protein
MKTIRKILIALVIVSYGLSIFVGLKGYANQAVVRVGNKKATPLAIRLHSLTKTIESYVYHYNMGLESYKEMEYLEAVGFFEEALKTVPKKRECSIRTNIGYTYLSYANQIGKEDVDYIPTLDKAINSFDKCLANNKDNDKAVSGKNEAEELKKEANQEKEEQNRKQDTEEKQQPDKVEQQQDDLNQSDQNNNIFNKENDRKKENSNYEEEVEDTI